MNIDYPLIFLDIDGVVTNYYSTPGSYIVNSLDKYGPSYSNCKLIETLCEDTGAKIIISSNWRNYDLTGENSFWISSYGKIPNPIPKLKKLLGNFIIGNLPFKRGLNKSECLILWFKENKFDKPFIIFDDDYYEYFQEIEDYDIKNHFIMTNVRYGVTVDDISKAKEILKKGYKC